MPSNVVFPEPDGPMMATNSPSETTRLTERSAETARAPLLYDFATSASAMTAPPA